MISSRTWSKLDVRNCAASVLWRVKRSLKVANASEPTSKLGRCTYLSKNFQRSSEYRIFAASSS
jgi:hypothetical protein